MGIRKYPIIVGSNREKLLPSYFHKVYPSLRAVQNAFYRKGVVAQKENQSHQKRPAFLMTLIEGVSFSIIDRWRS